MIRHNIRAEVYCMCGIIGYSGQNCAVERIIHGLKALEYRGYDSAGVACFDGDAVRVIKVAGRVKDLESAIEADGLSSSAGIGHTRWATHGAPVAENAHPFKIGKVSLVHNGIIENYSEIKERLTEKGVIFTSQTDTEVGAGLINSFYGLTKEPIAAIRCALDEIEGSYAFGMLFEDIPDKLYCAKKDSPLIVGIGEDGGYIASDISAILKYTRNYMTLMDGEVAVIEGKNITVYDANGDITEKDILTATWDAATAEKGGYAHFMLKEIHEEPEAIKRTLSPRYKNGIISFESDGITREDFEAINSLRIVACGTAMHAGLYAKTLIEKLARVPVIVETASEYRYEDPIVGEGDTVLIISQSGETADSREALNLSKRRGAKTIALVNVISSSIAREADKVIYTYAGPEISVCSTKAYIVQVATLCAFAFNLAYVKGKLEYSKLVSYSTVLMNRLGEAISEVIANEPMFADIASDLYRSEDVFFIGRGLDAYVVQEASLKLKEISYIHSESYPAGELKHGTISLITDGTPVCALATSNQTFEKIRSNIREVEARGANVFFICSNEYPFDTDTSYCYRLPEIDSLFAGIPASTAYQLFAYHMAALRGCDIDKPRNLAKSVTVE